MIMTNRIKNFFLSLIFPFLLFQPNIRPDQELPEDPSDLLEEFNNLDPETRKQLEEQFAKMREELLEEQLKPVLEIYRFIDVTCEHLGQVINNNQLPKIDIKKAREHIKNIRTALNQISKGSYVVVDAHSIKLLLALAEYIIDHLTYIVKYGLKTFPPLQLEEVITRNLNDQEIDFEQMQKQQMILFKKLQTLDRAAQNVGLSIFNRMYRRIEKFCVDHYVFSRTFKIGVAGLGIYWLLSRLDQKTIDKTGLNKVPGLSHLKGKIGDNGKYYEVPGKTPALINEENISKVGWVEHYLGPNGLGIINLAATPLITWATLLAPFESTWEHIKLWIFKKWENLRAFLRGGPVEQKVEVYKKEPKASFADVIGKEHHKGVLMRVIDYIRDAQRFIRAGIAPEAGYLFAGPSRSGKSYFAEAVSFEIKAALAERGVDNEFNFLSFNAADIKQWGIPTIMLLARDYAPCVVFIDEVDMCGWQRERDSQELSQILTWMSGFMNDPARPIIMLAATNRPENLDHALLQKGRFGKVLWFDYPSFEDRFAFLKRELENRSIMSIPDAYITKLAHETEGCNFDELKTIIITALQTSKARGEVLSEQHLESAFDEEIRNIMLDNLDMSDEQKRIMAVHQCGHALTSLLLDPNPHITKITIRAIKDPVQEESVFAKYTWDGEAKQAPRKNPIKLGEIFTDKPDVKNAIKTAEQITNDIKIMLAGHVAEKIVFGDSSYSYHNDDKQKALNVAKKLVFEGMNENALPKHVKQEKETRAYALINKCEKEVYHLLAAEKEVLLAMAQALQEKLSLSSVEVLELLKKETGVEEETAQQESHEEPVIAAEA